MNPERLMTLPCTITHVAQDGAVDVYGNPTDTTTTTVLTGSPGCWIEQVRRSEDTVDKDQQVGQWHGYFPPAVELDGSDRVEALGDVYEVDGPPWPAWNPRLRRVTHIEATLARVV